METEKGDGRGLRPKGLGTQNSPKLVSYTEFDFRPDHNSEDFLLDIGGGGGSWEKDFHPSAALGREQILVLDFTEAI